MKKPDTCPQECPLYHKGYGYAPPSGPVNAKMLFVGEALGTVEALKGKPFCLEENTLVLKSDLSWIPIAEVHIGDALLSFDEYGKDRGSGASGKDNRRYRISYVTAKYQRTAECEKLVTTDGELVGTPDHLLLTKPKPGSSRKWLKLGKAKSSTGTHNERPSRLSFLFSPWLEPSTYIPGWLAGFFDGDGTLAIRRQGSKQGIIAGFTQKQGATCEMAKLHVNSEGFSLRRHEEQRAYNNSIIEHCYIKGGSTETIRFLGTIRPQRLITNFIHAVITERSCPGVMPTSSMVLSREKVGQRQVIDIKTTTGTFIANGFMVHNCGPAGGTLTKLLKYVHIDRADVRIDNCIHCKPPGNWLLGAPWEIEALEYCSHHLEDSLSNNPAVVIPLGAIPLRRILHLTKQDAVMKNFHGTVTRDPANRFWVVPTYHPSHLLRGTDDPGEQGGRKLTGVVVHDLQVAKDIATKGFNRTPYKLIKDPDPAVFREWGEHVLANANDKWLAVDIETPEKAKGVDEGELKDDKSYIIDRVNFAFDPNEGVTVPFNPRYVYMIRKLLASPKLRKSFWNCPTPDQRILKADLTWVRAGELKVGDTLIGFDEETQAGRRVRRYKTAIVNHAGYGKASVIRVTFSDGTAVKTTRNHPWLLRRLPGKGKRKLPFHWIMTKDLVVGDIIQRPFIPWTEGKTWLHGYLSGMFDGEGCLSLQKVTQTIILQITQCLGATYDEIVNAIEDAGYVAQQYCNNKREKDSHIGQITVRGYVEDLVRFLGIIRPRRLLRKFKPEYLGAIQTRRGKDLTITSIIDLGQQRIVRLSTSTKTYFLEGFGAHNSGYDIPRLIYNEVKLIEPAHDLMDAWHMLQSDLPKGLGFVAPFFSDLGAWKHLADTDPATYAAMDGIQTLRITNGIEADMKKAGMWEFYLRHMYDLDRYALKPATKVGLLLHTNILGKGEGRLEGLNTRLDGIQTTIKTEISATVPPALHPLIKPPTKNPPKSTNLEVVKKTEEILTYTCSGCKKTDLPHTHKCKQLDLHQIKLVVDRYYRKGRFNPSSPAQMLAYALHKKHKLPKGKKGKLSMDRQVIEDLVAKTKDPLYIKVLELRDVTKVHGYTKGMLKVMDDKGRIHPQFTHKPSTLRLASEKPGVQNIVKKDRPDSKGLGTEFRKCIIAGPGCTLLEIDFSGIEAVLVGWFAHDPDYIRLAKLSVHAYLCSYLVDKPADLKWSDEHLAGYLKEIKKENKLNYEISKRVIHGSAYGLTPYGLTKTYPDLFKTKKDAEEVQELFFTVAPRVREWQDNVVALAHKQNYLGGEDHPYHYKHWFWDVLKYTPITASAMRYRNKNKKDYILINERPYSINRSTDANRAIAFFPQSTAGGIIKEAMLKLFIPGQPNYVGSSYFGKTPLRMPIHDSLVLEVMNNRVNTVLEKVKYAMTEPLEHLPCDPTWNIGTHLAIGVAVQAGKDWGNMEDV